jgi:hypothetical protein
MKKWALRRSFRSSSAREGILPSFFARTSMPSTPVLVSPKPAAAKHFPEQIQPANTGQVGQGRRVTHHAHKRDPAPAQTRCSAGLCHARPIPARKGCDSSRPTPMPCHPTTNHAGKGRRPIPVEAETIVRPRVSASRPEFPRLRSCVNRTPPEASFQGKHNQNAPAGWVTHETGIYGRTALRQPWGSGWVWMGVSAETPVDFSQRSFCAWAAAPSVTKCGVTKMSRLVFCLVSLV